MNGEREKLSRPFLLVAAAGALLYLFTAVSNIGIIALDDYNDIMARFLPAQQHSVQDIAAGTGFRSPFTNIIHLGVAKVAYALGAAHPVTQLRIDLAVVGLVNYLIILWAGWLAFAAFAEPERERYRTIFAGLLGFYFLAPLVLTRPMIESMAAPFLALAAALAARYQATGSRLQLGFSMVCLTIAAMHRPQVGICVVALLILVIWLKRWSDLVILALVGIACVVISGLLDYQLVGGFHETLRRYIRLHLENSSKWERRPWFTVPLLWVGLSLPPAFLLRYKGFDWKRQFTPLMAPLLFFGVFVVVHSMVALKEERFQIPAAPLFFMLLTPLLGFLIENRTTYRWRLWYFGVVNAVLLLLVVTSAPQRAALGMARWVDEHQEITTVTRVGDYLLVPTALVSHPVQALDSKTLEGVSLDCTGVVATLALTKTGRELIADPRLEMVGLFQPGPLERLIVAINPRHNARRGPVAVLRPSGCGDVG